MPNKVAVDQRAKDMIIELGLLIRDCRGTLSQSQLAKRVGLPRSNMKYIEDGVNAPTAEVYDKLIKELTGFAGTPAYGSPVYGNSESASAGYLPNYHTKQGFGRCNAEVGRL